MKKQFFFYSIFLALIVLLGCAPEICLGQEYYVKGNHRLIRSLYTNNLVEGINTVALVQKYLSEYHYGSPLSLWYWGYLYRFYKQGNDRMAVSIQIGVYPSIQEAEEIALYYLNTISTLFMEGPIQNESIGDNCWYALNNYSEKKVRSVSFLRKNVFMVVDVDYEAPNPFTYTDLIDLCKAIDSDILNGTSYISFADTPIPPAVSSVQVSKNELREGDVSIISISASDYMGKKLEYHGDFPGTKTDENTFFIRYSKDNFPANFFGTTQTFSVWAVNENNLFSRKKEFQITF